MSEKLKPNSIMATLSLKILPNRRKSSGKLEIYICLTHKKSQRYINTGIEIDDEFQFEKGFVCYRKDARILNQRLSYVLDMYSERLGKITVEKYPTCAALKEALLREERRKEKYTISGLFSWTIFSSSELAELCHLPKRTA
jgi:hypothetical protein